MFPPEVVFCQVVGGCGQAHHPFPSRSQTTCRRGFVFQMVDWTLIHRFVDGTRIHSKPSGDSLKPFFIVFHGGCQTGFRQCERPSMCITSCLSASASKHVCSPCMSWPFRGPCVCGNRYVHPGKASQPTTCRGAEGVRGGLCPSKLLPTLQENVPACLRLGPVVGSGRDIHFIHPHLSSCYVIPSCLA